MILIVQNFKRIKTNAYEYSKDNGTTWTTPSSGKTYTFTGIAAGTYQCKVRVTDNAGNNTISNTVQILVGDGTDGTIAFTNGCTLSAGGGGGTITVTSITNSSRVQYKLQ